MATTPEQSFYNWLTSQVPWFFQRIETTTGSGVPDIWAAHKGSSLWIELKACPATNVQIRKSQYAWISKADWNGIKVWIFNRPPKRIKKIQLWRPPFQVKEGKKDHLKIISAPNLEFSSENFPTLINEIIKE